MPAGSGEGAANHTAPEGLKQCSDHPSFATNLDAVAAMPQPLANPNKILHHMTTTAPLLDGYQVVENLGVVLGVTVRSRSVFGLFFASLETIRGGQIRLFTELCERTRAEAFELMLQHAEQHGGNAVLAIKYDATEVMRGVTEVLCYGTAVVVEPVPAG
jgi:uncharacterized protein YbjQ (UPF0145 family)